MSGRAREPLPAEGGAAVVGGQREGWPDVLRREARERLTVSRAGVGLILVMLLAVNVYLQPGLLNLIEIGAQIQVALPLAFLAFGQTLVILTKGIDLSLGGILAVSATMSATWAGGGTVTGRPVVLIGILAIGLACGALNGALIAFVRLEPFVVTLATWAIFDGIALHVLATDGGQPPQALTTIVTGSVGQIPNALLILAGMIILWLYFKGTRLGRSIYAVGSDEERMVLQGGASRRTKFLAYTLSGGGAALAGMALAGLTVTGSPTAGDAYILQSVAAVVIGGTSLLGGRGGYGRTLAGVFILITVASIITAAELSYVVGIVVDAVLLVIVAGGPAVWEAWRSR